MEEIVYIPDWMSGKNTNFHNYKCPVCDYECRFSFNQDYPEWKCPEHSYVIIGDEGMKKRVRQIRDALNKCKNPDIIENIGKILNV